MKLTKSKLQQLIKEELNTTLKEYGIGGPGRAGGISDSETPEEFVEQLYALMDRPEEISQFNSMQIRNILNTGGMLANPTGQGGPVPAAGMGPALQKFMSRIDPDLQQDRDVQSVERTTMRKLNR